MTNNLQIKDVFFDLDHTLWDFDKNSMLAYKRVFNKFEIDVDFDDFIKSPNMSFTDYPNSYKFVQFLRRLVNLLRKFGFYPK